MARNNLDLEEENNCIVVDFAIPCDARIEQKEKEKVDKTISGFEERTPENVEYESKSSPNSYRSIRNTTKRYQKESKRTRNLSKH